MKKILLMAVAVVIGGQFLAAQDTKSGILSNVTQLTNDDVKYENPRWSPDGEKIAFTEFGYDGLYTMNANCLFFMLFFHFFIAFLIIKA